jgi:hypothetical protein
MADHVRVLTAYPPTAHVTSKEAAARQARRPTLAGELRQAARAGVSVRSASIEPDGRLTLHFGEPRSSDNGNDLDVWLAKHADSAEGH